MSAIDYSEMLSERTLGDGHVFLSNVSRDCSSKDYRNPFVFQWKHTGVYIKMQLCRAWRNMRHPFQSYRMIRKVVAFAATIMEITGSNKNNL